MIGFLLEKPTLPIATQVRLEERERDEREREMRERERER